MVIAPGVDIFGQPLNKIPSVEFICPNCKKKVGSIRYTQHLEKCMKLKRARVARQRICTITNGRTITAQSNNKIGNCLTGKPRRNSMDSLIAATAKAAAKKSWAASAKSRRNSLDSLLPANSKSLANKNPIKAAPVKSRGNSTDAVLITEPEPTPTTSKSANKNTMANPVPIKLRKKSTDTDTNVEKPPTTSILSALLSKPTNSRSFGSYTWPPIETFRYQAPPVPVLSPPVGQPTNPMRTAPSLGLYEDISGESGEDEFEDVNEMIWEEHASFAKLESTKK